MYERCGIPTWLRQLVLGRLVHSEGTVTKCALRDQRNPHNDGFFRKGELPVEHHVLPNDGSPALLDECAVRTFRKCGECLGEGGVGRFQLLLGGRVVVVAVFVDILAAGAKVGRGQGRRDVAQE